MVLAEAGVDAGDSDELKPVQLCVVVSNSAESNCGEKADGSSN